MRVGVMEGHLSEFDLAAILQVVGLGRQYTGVEVRHDDGSVATIFVKSGLIVSVHAPPAEGKQAFFDMFAGNEGHFSVFRTETPLSLPEPLGAMHHLLLEAASSAPPPRRNAHPSSPVITVSTPPSQRPSVIPFAGLEMPANASLAQLAPAPLPRENRPALAPPRNGAPASVALASVERKSLARPAPITAPRKVTRVQVVANGSGGRVIAVVSPKGGCGKTTIALNAAIALARQGHPVILVDADVNGDILSAINARSRAEFGTYDVVEGRARPEQGLLRTVMPHFRILPAVGARLPSPATLSSDITAELRGLLQTLSREANVIVDAPAGMFGVTRQILSSSTHVVAILQAEVVAHRSFARFAEALNGMPEAERPRVLGVVINMLQMRHGASLSVLQNMCTELPSDWLFETSIPRHQAFIDATAQGVPVRHMDETTPPAVAFLFDTLAAEIAQRLSLVPPKARPQSLLL